MKPYTFHELKSTAQELFISLIDNSEHPLTTRSGSAEAQPITPEMVDRHVDNLRKQAWGLAEWFLDYGYEKFEGLFVERMPLAESLSQSTEAETLGGVPADVSEALHDHSEGAADDPDKGTDEELPVATKKTPSKKKTASKFS